MGDFAFDRYLTYDEMMQWLSDVEADNPHLVEIETIGVSYEGRDVVAVTLTDREAGGPESKPALYVDGNIHAGEVTASMTCLYLINYLTDARGVDPRVQKILESRTIYIIPRANPDGAEKYLTTPEHLRSSVRPFPEYRRNYDPPGLRAEDIDGDGRVLIMRVRDDECGSWKIDPEDQRLMIERRPDDLEGPFYHLYSEGVIRDEDGDMVGDARLPLEVVETRYGLDLNRNFPAGYRPTADGAGPYPLSEPETRNLVQFISEHPNIGGALAYHTTGGVLFRPHSTIKDEDFSDDDMRMYETIGGWGTEATGYPVVCCYGDIWSGVLDDWCWEHKGIFAFTPELWDLVGRAAPETHEDPMQVHKMPAPKRQELERKILRYHDHYLGARGFVDWRSFEHPQLGHVEIGGWDVKECWQNPPRAFLSAECHKNIQFPLMFALALPEVHIDELTVERLGGGECLVSVLVSNRGYLDTCISAQARKQKAVREDVAHLQLPEGTEILTGRKTTEIGFLRGYRGGPDRQPIDSGENDAHRKRVQWTVRLLEPAVGCEVAVLIRSERGGTSRRAAKF